MLEIDPRTAPPEPSLLESLVRVLEAGQRIVLDRIDLARFDVSQVARRMLRAAGLLAIGAILLAGGWFTLMAGGVCWLQQYLSLPVSLVLAATLTAGLGAAALAVGVRRMRDEGAGAGGVVDAAAEAARGG